MLGRVFAIAMNTYREAVRARVLFGLLAAALALSSYALVVASMSLKDETRVVADLGSGGISMFSILVAIVLGATSLYRELELKTVFPILTRRLRRGEYVVGKYLGIVSVLVAFAAIDGAWVLGILAMQSGEHVGLTASIALLLLVALGLALWRAKRRRVFIVLPWALVAFVVTALLADASASDRQVLILSTVLTVAEVSIVAAIATLFSSFSSPFLTAIFTFMVFLIGRSADLLGNLPEKLFTHTGHVVGRALARVFPNLNLYVPARTVLLGEVPSIDLTSYIVRAWGNAVLYAVVLLVLSAIVFRRRDFQ